MKAFPSAEPVYSNDIVGVKENKGMDLRDYFAAKALQVFMNNGGFNQPDAGAKLAYEYADAMIRVRNENN